MLIKNVILALLTAAFLPLVISCQQKRQPTENSTFAYPKEEWQLSQPATAGLDSLAMMEALLYLESACKSDGISEVMLIKDSKLLFRGDSTSKVHGVWSITKSITSTIFGMMEANEQISLDESVYHALPYLSYRYPEVQYKHLLTLTSGYDAVGANNPSHIERYGFGDSSPTPWIPGEPLFPPGDAFCYWDESMNVLAHAMTRVLDETLESYFEREVASKIGMNKAEWHWKSWEDADGDVLNGGSGCCDTQLYMSANQLARLGYLYLREGQWNEQQIIDREWIEQATKNHVDKNLNLAEGPRQQIDARGCYGFNWWINDISSQNELLMPALPKGTYFASGFNNNMLFVIPEWDMVFVRSGVDGNPEDKLGVYNQFFELLSKSF